MTIIAFLSAGLGLLLISWSAFSYEPEERRRNEVVEEWWIRFYDASARSVARHFEFVRRLSQTIAAWLNTIVGERLWSLRALAASCALSLSSAFIVQFALGLWSGREHVAVLLSKFLVPAFGLYWAAVTGRPVFRHVRTIVVVLVCASFAAAAVTAPVVTKYPAGQIGLAYVTALVLAVLADFAVILMARYVARYCMRADDVSWSLVAIFTMTTVGLGLCIMPFAVAYRSALPMWIRVAVFFAGVTNLYAAVVAASFVLLSVTLLLNRSLRAVISRPLYAIQRFRILQHPKLLFFAGVALVGVALPRFADFLVAAARLISP